MLTSVAQRWRLAVGITGLGALLGLGVVALFAPTTYQATIRLEVRPNLGGITNNTSADASMESVALTQPNMLHAARTSLHGAATGDPSALYRARCGRNAGDNVVICRTGSGDRSAVRAVLSQLMTTAVPILVQTQIQAFRDTREEMLAQIQQLAAVDDRLRREIQELQSSRPTTRTKSTLIIDKSQLRDKSAIQADIRSRVASVRRQILYEPSTLRIASPGATISAATRTQPIAVGAGAGTILGLMVALFFVFLLASPRVSTASGSRRRRGRALEPQRRPANSQG
jgi:uncharacterized protein involved in exopolysaccharide biosynthesis